ncbi:MAG: DegT/DnrJ/EryC1/StrS family aminotransferase [Odoribacter sp.]
MEKNERLIGGEFEIDPSLFQDLGEFKEEGQFYSSGRSALFHILTSLPVRDHQQMIFLPDYLCESIIEVVRHTNLRICYYPILENLKPDLSYLLSCDLSDVIILFINYFGGIDLRADISILKAHNSTTFIIEDNVQALYAMYQSTEADVSFTSFRKTLSVPDGGWVKTNSFVLREATEQNTFVDYKIAGSVLKQYRQFDCVCDKNYLQLFEKGEHLIDNNLMSCMSEFTYRILSHLDLQKIATVRRGNASYLIERLKEIEIFPIIEFEDDKVPLFVPIRVQNRNEIRHFLFNEKIYCPCHWSCSNNVLKRGHEMEKNELSLIIDQRYDFADMDRIVDVLKKYYGGIYHR